jgi:hypothetical protein
LWVVGYKTERGGTLLETRGNGHSEILGGFSYTTTAGKLAPMFVTDNSSVFTFFNEVCYNGLHSSPGVDHISCRSPNRTLSVLIDRFWLMPE